MNITSTGIRPTIAQKSPKLASAKKTTFDDQWRRLYDNKDAVIWSSIGTAAGLVGAYGHKLGIHPLIGGGVAAAAGIVLGTSAGMSLGQVTGYFAAGQKADYGKMMDHESMLGLTGAIAGALIGGGSNFTGPLAPVALGLMGAASKVLPSHSGYDNFMVP